MLACVIHALLCVLILRLRSILFDKCNTNKLGVSCEDALEVWDVRAVAMHHPILV